MMTSRERFITAIKGGVADRVPVTPDISNYIPCKRTGLPFWEIYFKNTVPLYKAYIDAAVYYGIDGWVASCFGIPAKYSNDHVTFESKLVQRDHESMIKETVIHTPDGDLFSKDLCYAGDPPSPIEKSIKDFETDFKKYKWTLKSGYKVDLEASDKMKEYFHSHDMAYGGCVSYPGFHMWLCHMNGGLLDLSVIEMEHPEWLEEWYELDIAVGDQIIKANIDANPDYILYGGSGSLTMASPALVRKYVIPALKRWSKWTKDAGIPSMIHSCGLSRLFVDMLIEDTDIDCVNPLEMPPMGDIDIAEVKRNCGDKIALMGNLHTTNTMLKGSTEDVTEAAKYTIKVAGKNGGFVLSPGDQCGRETPDENLFALVEAAKKYGVYDEKGNLPGLE